MKRIEISNGRLDLNDPNYQPKLPQYDVPLDTNAKPVEFQPIQYDKSTGRLNSDSVYKQRKEAADAQIVEKNRAEALQLGTDSIPIDTTDQTNPQQSSAAPPTSPVSSLWGSPQESASVDAVVVSDATKVDPQPVANPRVVASGEFLQGAMSGFESQSAESYLDVAASAPADTTAQPQVLSGLNPEAGYKEPTAVTTPERASIEPEAAAYAPEPALNASIGGVFSDSASSYAGGSLASSLAMLGWADENMMGSQSVDYDSGYNDNVDYNSRVYLTASA